MNVTAIKPQGMAERHVQFSEFVEVRHISPLESVATTTEMQPSIYAQRLAHELRNMPCVEAQQQAQPTQSKPLQAYKNVLHTVAMVCGALVIPSFACLFLGPIGLIVPAVLTSLWLTCILIAGRPTEMMERIRAERAAEMSEYDPR